jgi:hypothetical protein
MTTSPGQPSSDHTRSCAGQSTVNDGLIQNTHGRSSRNSEYAAYAQRVLRAYGRRVASGDVESPACMLSQSDDIGNAIQQPSAGCGPLATPGPR